MHTLQVTGPLRPVMSLPQYTPTFKFKDEEALGPCASNSDFPFTLPGILLSAVNHGYAMGEQPPGLALTLFPFQLQTLKWMQDRESIPGGLNSLFWERREWAGGEPFWYFPLAGELRTSEPPMTRGGLLCEEMGLVRA